MLNWLLIFVPAAIGLEFLRPDSHALIFIASCLAIIPLAGWLGRATEQLAHHTGEGIGGLLNATFGNAAELIIAIMALRQGLYPVVKASLTGSIIGNMLLVLGAAFLSGGLKHKEQNFNATGAQAQSTLLTLAAISLIMPAAFHYLAGPQGSVGESGISLEISVVLLLVYGAHLLFSLKTHKALFEGEAVQQEDGCEAVWSIGKSIGVLVGATALVAWVSEILVGSVQQAASQFGMTSIFIGVIVVAVIGNAAEHSTAVLFALRNRMELSMGIAIGSSLQIALFVAPALVILSHFVGPRPMDLVFTPAEVLAVFLSVLITSQISSDGKSNWLEGVMLLAVYMILGVIFYFLPDIPSGQPGGTGALTNWHDIADPNDPELDRLANQYGIHPLHIEDCRHRSQRAKVEEGQGYIFVVLKPVAGEADDELVFHDLDIFLGQDWVITVQEGNHEACEKLLAPVHAAAATLTAPQVFYRVGDAAIDSYLPIMDRTDDIIDELEQQVLENPDPEVLSRIFRTRRTLIEVRRVLANTRDVAAHLYRTQHDLIPADLIPFLRDIYDHVARNLDLVETQRDMLGGAMDVYLSSVANRTNQVMKVLTVAGTAALPALVISGYFGMNLKGLPFSESPHGTLIVTGLMAIFTAALLAVLKWLDWF